MRRVKLKNHTVVDRVKFINHKGKSILYLDFSDCTCEEVLKVVEAGEKVMMAQPKHSLLTLTNVKGTLFDPKVVEVMEAFLVHGEPYGKKGAVIGISGLQKVIYNILIASTGRNFPLFDDIEKAKDWLVED